MPQLQEIVMWLQRLTSQTLFFLCVGSLTGCVVVPPAAESETLTDVHQLTRDFERAGEAYFSSDGRYIVFQAVPMGELQYQMFVASFNAGDKRTPATLGKAVRISPVRSRNTCGFFSPDGKSILFGSTAGKDDANEAAPGYQRKTGNYRWEFSAGMEIYRADGWQRAIDTAEKSALPRPTLDFARNALTDNDAYDAECAFSPDGEWIVFASNREDDDVELYVMRADGSSPVRLTHAKGYDGGPFFSPDGKKILYRSDRSGNDLLQLYVADVDFDAYGNIKGLKNERRLTPGAHVNWGPFWHPSGKYILYASSAAGHTNYELYMMRADGTKNCRITFSADFDGLPVFSADGRKVMWSSKRTANDTTQVFVADFKVPRYVR
jgi:TolB protein